MVKLDIADFAGARAPDFGPVYAMARPAAMPVPLERRVAALTQPDIFERWSADLGAIRPAALEAGDNVITMFDVIGYDYWDGSGVTAVKVAAQLRAIGDRPVEVQINSPGGDMFEGIAIYNVLREHPQPVTVKVMGLAASAASIIAMAADTLEIGAASFLMIHNCWVISAGNRHDMAATAEYLAPFDQAMADVYAQRAGGEAKDFAAMMDKETYLSGSQAVALGLADALLPADQVALDASAGAAAKVVSEVRGMEHLLMASGKTRAEARAHINKIKGKPDAAQDGTPDAAAIDWADVMSGLSDTLLS